MDQAQQKEIKTLIETEIKKTEASIVEYEENARPIAPDNAIGRVSRMDAINNRSVAQASLRQAKQKLMLLRDALGKVGNDDFGICERCKNPIPVGRIVLMPQSRFCVNCAR